MRKGELSSNVESLEIQLSEALNNQINTQHRGRLYSALKRQASSGNIKGICVSTRFVVYKVCGPNSDIYL